MTIGKILRATSPRLFANAIFHIGIAFNNKPIAESGRDTVDHHSFAVLFAWGGTTLLSTLKRHSILYKQNVDPLHRLHCRMPTKVSVRERFLVEHPRLLQYRI